METAGSRVVLDCSVLIAWLMPDESLEGIEELMLAIENRQVQAWVQSLLYQELTNALLIAERRSRLPEGVMIDYVESMLALNLNVSPYPTHPAGLAKSIELADLYQLSIYDASYLALAVHLQAPLATADNKLVEAARQEALLWQ